MDEVITNINPVFLKNRLARKSSFIYLLIWWLLSTGVYLFIYIPTTNQIVLKIIIPFLLIVLIIHEKKLFIDRGLTSYIFLILWGGLSIFYSVNLLLTETYLQMLAGNVIIWYIAARCIKKIHNILVLCYPLFISLFIQAYVTITAPVQQASNVVNQGLERVTGLSSNENDQARLLFFGVVVAILLILYLQNGFFKAIYASSIVIFIIGILKTGSRECFIALGGFVLTFLFLTVKKKKYGYLILAILLIMMFYNLGYQYILNNTVLGRRMEIAVNQGEENIRFTLIKEGWNFFLTHPFFGIGLGSFTTLSSTNQYSHNDYIEILASMGIPAFLIYMNIYLDYLRKGKKVFSRYKGYYKNAIIVAISFLFGYLCLGIFDPIFYYPPTTLMLAFYYSLISKIYHEYIFKRLSQVPTKNNGTTYNRVISFEKI